ncbi:MAG: divalent-cation tolerance protein CutA [Candidatus Thermoplasmatota archaeon]|nr:divalent-cation tolerance protein CutA [Candidatus Thermoplasmatota archaeon]
MNYIMVFCTCEKEEAERIAKTLTEEKLVACISMSDVKSFFWWNKKVEEKKEVILVMKSREDMWASIKDRIKEMHSYEIPEIVAVPVKYGLYDYFNWIDEIVGEK